MQTIQQFIVTLTYPGGERFVSEELERIIDFTFTNSPVSVQVVPAPTQHMQDDDRVLDEILHQIENRIAYLRTTIREGKPKQQDVINIDPRYSSQSFIASQDHVHNINNGQCIKNRYGPRCN
jgi:hypothetical protein